MEAYNNKYDGTLIFSLNGNLPKIVFFISEVKPRKLSVSLRARGKETVHDIAERFGGGGHRKAAGFSMIGSADELAEQILKAIAEKYEAPVLAERVLQ